MRLRMWAQGLALAAFIGSGVFCANPSAAQVPPPPGGHPHYLHAVSDLQAADALLQMPDPNQNIVNDQKHAQLAVERAIGDCKHASYWNGLPTNYTPAPDVRSGAGRLREINRLLHASLLDLQAPDESGGRAEGWHKKAIKHIEEAIGDYAQVLADAHMDPNEGIVVTPPGE